MSKVEKVSIALTSELASDVRLAVESGGYASVSEVVREALREWAARREDRAAKLLDLRAAIRAGLDSGIGSRPRTAEEIMADGRRRLGVKARA